MYIQSKNVDFEWNRKKADANLTKHGVDFADCVAVFTDDRGITIQELSSEDEKRWITIGLDSLGRLIDVVYTWRGDRIRIISAWKASKTEQEQYGRKE